MSRCPICDEVLQDGPVVMVTDSVVGERQAECPNGHYAEEFAYGAWRISAGRHEFYDDYGEEQAIRRLRFWWKVCAPLRWLKRLFGR